MHLSNSPFGMPLLMTLDPSTLPCHIQAIAKCFQARSRGKRSAHVSGLASIRPTELFEVGSKPSALWQSLSEYAQTLIDLHHPPVARKNPLNCRERIALNIRAHDQGWKQVFFERKRLFLMDSRPSSLPPLPCVSVPSWQFTSQNIDKS